MNGTPWTPAEDAELRRRYGKEDAFVIAIDLRRSLKQVYGRAKTLNLTKCVPRPTAARLERIRRLNRRGLTDAEIAPLVGLCRKQVEHYRRQAELPASAAGVLRRRERELLDPPPVAVGQISFARRYTWFFGFPEAMAFDPQWRRGFVAAVTCTAAGWLQHGKAICAAQPVERVVLSDRKPLPYDHMIDPATAKDFVWWYSRIESQNKNPRGQNTLPKQLWDMLPCNRTVNHWKHYPTEAAALDALSAACLAFARPVAAEARPPLPGGACGR